MPVHPPEPVFIALREASKRTLMPLTLLMAVAKVESNFDPLAINPQPTKAGWQAKGLMQLSPANIAAWGVKDPFNAADSAMGGALLLTELALRTDNSMRRMLAAYNWGATRSEALPPPAEYPKAVEDYIRKVTATRAYYENLAVPKGATASERIANAIKGLLELNPELPAVKKLAARWAESNKGAKITDSPDEYNVGLLADFWREYSTIYPIAPITDGRTPPPWKLNPDLWPKVAKLADQGAKMVIDVVADSTNYVKKIGEDVAIGAGGAAVVVGVLWLAISSKRRGRG